MTALWKCPDLKRIFEYALGDEGSEADEMDITGLWVDFERVETAFAK